MDCPPRDVDREKSTALQPAEERIGTSCGVAQVIKKRDTKKHVAWLTEAKGKLEKLSAPAQILSLRKENANLQERLEKVENELQRKIEISHDNEEKLKKIAKILKKLKSDLEEKEMN